MLLKKSRQGDIIKIDEAALLAGLTVACLGSNAEMSLLDYAEGLAETLSVSGIAFEFSSPSLPQLHSADARGSLDSVQTVQAVGSIV